MKIFLYGDVKLITPVVEECLKKKPNWVIVSVDTVDIYDARENDESTQELWLVAADQLEDWKVKHINSFYCISGGKASITDKQCVGILSSNMLNTLSHRELYNIFNCYIEVFEKRYLEQEVNEMTDELEVLHRRVLEELSLVKNIYKTVVPLRHEKFSEVMISSKFSSGLQGGGEYFEWNKDAKGLKFYIFSTSSYALTAIFSNVFVDLFTGNSTSNQQQLFDTIVNEFLKFQEKKEVTCHFLFFDIDFTSMTLRGCSLGDHQLVTDKEDFIGVATSTLGTYEQHCFNHTLSKGEKLLVVSHGFRASLRDLSLSSEVSISSLKEYSPREFFDIEFMKLFEKNNDDFLPFDSSLILFEVLKNGIFKV